MEAHYFANKTFLFLSLFLITIPFPTPRQLTNTKPWVTKLMGHLDHDGVAGCGGEVWIDIKKLGTDSKQLNSIFNIISSSLATIGQTLFGK